jgi:hypothetical protein
MVCLSDVDGGIHPVSTKGLVITLSGLIAAIALVVAMMVVRSVPLGPDGPSISSAQLAKRTAAADRLQGRLRTLANDVPPALPDVPQRLTAAGTGATGAASNAPTGNTPVARTLSNTSQPVARSSSSPGGERDSDEDDDYEHEGAEGDGGEYEDD